MTFEEYQKSTQETAIYPRETPIQAINYCILGLAGEAGELCNKIKKSYRDDNSIVTIKKREELIDEASDCAWYLSQLCTELNITLSELATYNIQKLKKRKENNKLQGSGDSR